MIVCQTPWHVRAALPNDAAQMVTVIHAAYAEYAGGLDPPSGAHDETEESVRAWFETGGAAAAEAEGRLVGVVHFAPLPEALYLGRLAVLPTWRNHGVGRALVAYVERVAAPRGLMRVTLGVRIQLPENRAFYEALGYSTVALGTHDGYTKPTYYRMEKIIAPDGSNGMMAW